MARAKSPWVPNGALNVYNALLHLKSEHTVSQEYSTLHQQNDLRHFSCALALTKARHKGFMNYESKSRQSMESMRSLGNSIWSHVEKR